MFSQGYMYFHVNTDNFQLWFIPQIVSNPDKSLKKIKIMILLCFRVVYTCIIQETISLKILKAWDANLKGKNQNACWSDHDKILHLPAVMASAKFYDLTMKTAAWNYKTCYSTYLNMISQSSRVKHASGSECIVKLEVLIQKPYN